MRTRCSCIVTMSRVESVADREGRKEGDKLSRRATLQAELEVKIVIVSTCPTFQANQLLTSGIVALYPPVPAGACTSASEAK